MKHVRNSQCKRLILIDGNSLFYRSYHALPTTLTYDGKPINAVYGFSNMLLKAISDIKPTHIVVTWDTFAPTFRHLDFAEYKATRLAPPDDLFPQKPHLQKVLVAFGIPEFELHGYEADDLIATLATQAEKQKVDEIFILTGDRDTFQLVSPKVKIYTSGQKLEPVIYDRAKIKEKYNLLPSQMNDFKAMVGDPSDNIAGVSGIGPKTASDLLSKYKDLDGIYKHLKELPDALREKLEKGKEQAYIARKLVELDRKAPVKLDLSACKADFDWGRIRETLEEFHFRSLVGKLPGVESEEENKEKKKNQLNLV